MRLSRVFFLAGILVFSPIVVSATEYFVSIVDFAFSPADLTISEGDMVTWTNNGNFTHTSTSDGGVWNSGDLTNGQSFTFTFSSAGTYPYHCFYHPSMTGTITVQQPQDIPTLSEWGMILLSLLLIGTGTVAVIRRRRLAAARQA